MTPSRTSAPRRSRGLSPAHAAVRGAFAGIAGTIALDLVNYVEFRAGGGSDAPLRWEFAAGLSSWDQAPVPAQVGKRLAEGFLQRELPASSARLVNNLTHWVYGIAWGAQYGIVAASTRRRGGVRRGAMFGTLVWLSGYAVLPVAKLYKPIWEYDGPTLLKDWAGHLAYGTATAVAFRGRRR